MAMPDAAKKSFAQHLAGQGAMLTAGLAAGQLFALGRNSCLAHVLSKGDFGIAASLTLTLQVLEVASDTAADRLIVQDRDGDNADVVNAAHTILLLRGLLIACVLWLGAPSIAALFHVEHAEQAFRWLAVIPVVKAFSHLDARRMQRHYQNQAVVMIEFIPQAATFAMALPLAYVYGDYHAVIWLSIAQAAFATVVSHFAAVRPWGLNLDRETLKRFLAFGWPVMLAALPMIAVNQFDRIVIGRYLGMEDLAAYTAAFLITSAPGVILIKVANSLMLPLLSEFQDDQPRFSARFFIVSEIVVIAASLYLVFFVVAGGPVVQLAFGQKYAGLGLLAALLASAWSARILALASGVALMAKGDTKSSLIAVTIRASSLSIALYAAFAGYGLTGIAAAGIAGDVLSISYLTWRAGVTGPGHAQFLASRSCFLLPVALAAALTAEAVAGHTALTYGAMLLLALTVTAAAIAIMPRSRSALTEFITSAFARWNAFRATAAAQ
jgi:O-antigen/teichoic acid export membrane protein